MTDPTNPISPEAQLERLQQLQRRRSAAPAPAPSNNGAKSGNSKNGSSAHRIGPATGAKIATAGFFTATMFGMVGAMAIAQNATSAAANTTPATVPLAPTTTAQPKVIVVVHHVDANGKPIAAPKMNAAGTNTAGAKTSGAQTAAPAVVPVTAPPIALTAAPVIQRAPAAAAPVARSSGSRH
jgi:hypothetical protein